MRYLIEDAKCGHDTVFDRYSPHTTVASAINHKEDSSERGWLYCIHPDRSWPMIALYERCL